jgi:aminopeptidase N
MKKGFLILVLTITVLATTSCAQVLNSKKEFTRQDTLRGSITPERAWWDVIHYTIGVAPDYNTKTIEGKSEIRFKVLASNTKMQIDLQEPMKIERAYWDKGSLPIEREGNVYYINFPVALEQGSIQTITLVYNGTPREAKNAPWDGGWIWKKDTEGRPWMSVAVQGLGASAWYPCKDHQSDEPDRGAILNIAIPDTLVAVANGKLKSKVSHSPGMITYKWEVTNPINSYNLVPYIGKYVNFTETYKGEKGDLNCSYWVLDYNLEKARQQFKQAPMTIKAFEHWFGPFPWYEDDFKLVEAPHLGMEHQSAVAYGNKFENGYLGKDLSGTGVGKKWDFIIVHEVGHEWFANNITTKDIADMWVHEGFTSYSETLFTEFHFGKEDANKYVQGIRKNIANKGNIIGTYGVNKEGSGDMYYKGSNLLHTIRQIINDDKKFREILRGLNKDFYHQTVTSKQVEEYISKQSGTDFSKVFDQYLRTTQIPQLALDVDGDVLKYRWNNSIEAFNMPVKLTNGQWLKPTTSWKQIKMEKDAALKISADPNFYITVKKE